MSMEKISGTAENDQSVHAENSLRRMLLVPAGPKHPLLSSCARNNTSPLQYKTLTKAMSISLAEDTGKCTAKLALGNTAAQGHIRRQHLA